MPQLKSKAGDENSIADAINNTVTKNDVLLVAQRFTQDTKVQVLDYDLGAYSTEKLGFLATHRQLTIKLRKQDSNDLETIKLFVKSVPYECQKQAAFLNDTGVFDEEYNFFSKLAPQFMENYVGEKFAPICYLAKPDSLIMEDLRCENYQMRSSFFDNYPEIKSALSTLARFHACSIIAEAKLNELSKKPTTLKDQYSNFLTEKMFRKDIKSYTWIKNGTKIICIIGKNLGQNPEKLRNGIEQIYKIVKPSKIHRNVIAHSDLWTNNIMFDETKPTPKSVLVDFQVLRYAPQVLDVLKLLYLHSSCEFRNNHEGELVQVYQSVMKKTVEKSGLSSTTIVPTLGEVITAMEDLKLFGAGMACLYLPMVLLDPEILKDRTKDSEGFNDFVFGDRVDVTLDYMKKNKVYKDRVEKAITEFAGYCDKL